MHHLKSRLPTDIMKTKSRTAPGFSVNIPGLIAKKTNLIIILPHTYKTIILLFYTYYYFKASLSRF